MKLLRSVIMAFWILCASLAVCVGAPVSLTTKIIAGNSGPLSLEDVSQIGMARMLEYQITSELGERTLDRERVLEIGVDCLDSQFGLSLDEGTASYFGNFRSSDDPVVARRQQKLLLCVQRGIRGDIRSSPETSGVTSPKNSFQNRFDEEDPFLPSPLLAAMTSFGFVLFIGFLGAAILSRPRR